MADSEPLRCPLCGASLSPEQTECAACGEAIPKPEPVGKFRWRFIPTALLTIFGGFFILIGVMMLVMCGVVAVYPQKRMPLTILFGMGLVYLCAGQLWLLGASWCWQRRWLRFALAFFGGYAVMGILSFLFPRLN